MRRIPTLLRRAAAENGHSMIELLTVLGILGIVVAPIVLLFASGSKAQVDMNQRFQAQQSARVALSTLRRQVHCAASATTNALAAPANAAPGTASSVTLTPPVGGCGTSLTAATTWCTLQLGENRFGLFRKVGTTCDTAGVKVADYLTAVNGTAANVFLYKPRSVDRLATLRVDFLVDLDSNPAGAYRLQDELALRRSGRAA
jgi:Tfp pilus assembly protein PilW